MACSGSYLEPSHCLVSEQDCTGMSIFSQCHMLFQQLVVATDFCHRLGIVNRDIKLENVLISGEVAAGMDAKPQLKLALGQGLSSLDRDTFFRRGRLP